MRTIAIIPDKEMIYICLGVTLTMYQKGVYYSDIKIFNILPKAITYFCSKPNKFKIVLKRFLYAHSFYTLNEFFNQ
jgi:hypothetical protein